MSWYTSAAFVYKINWAATFPLLEIEAGKESYKEFISTDLLSAVNSGKNVYMNYMLHYYKSQMHIRTLNWRENGVHSELIRRIL